MGARRAPGRVDSCEEKFNLGRREKQTNTRVSLPSLAPRYTSARYTPMARNPPANAVMTYLCEGGRGAPAQRSYAMATLDPAAGWVTVGRRGEGPGRASAWTTRRGAGGHRGALGRVARPTEAHGRADDATLEAVGAVSPPHRTSDDARESARSGALGVGGPPRARKKLTRARRQCPALSRACPHREGVGSTGCLQTKTRGFRRGVPASHTFARAPPR